MDVHNADSKFDPSTLAIREQTTQSQEQQPEASEPVMIEQRALDEFLELVNDQLEAELEGIETQFTALLNACKGLAALPPTTECAPPASGLDENRKLGEEVYKVYQKKP